MLIQWQKGRHLYEGFLADRAHLSIKDIDAIKGRYGQEVMGLHLDGKTIGEGSLERYGDKRSKFLNTTGTQLFSGQRNKGHGIVLYIFLVETARILGARRIYSDDRLNKHSRRMWKEKLPAIYDVKSIPGRCGRCHRPAPGKPIYYIDLEEKK